MDDERFIYFHSEDSYSPDIINAIKDGEAILSVSEVLARQIATIYPIRGLSLVHNLAESKRLLTAYPMNIKFSKTPLGRKVFAACRILVESGLNDFMSRRYGLAHRSVHQLSTSSEYSVVRTVNPASFFKVARGPIVALLAIPWIRLMCYLTSRLKKKASTGMDAEMWSTDGM